MMILMILLIITMIISNIVMILASILSKKSFYDREKNSPFECGFEPFNSSRLPFSLRFFLIAIIFLIFDVEIALMFPMIFSLKINSLINWSITILIFLMVLILGLFHEWNQGALDWNN
ncbi:NADH dehydrogenase subunit 3 (mitochondrion) [Culicoides brevitarsis]|uniref:NADH dehydrogenase subunit 3 n=1 Tax=Culicoides brevitarsis TaxID=469753 RepID=UPI002E773F09|nr:NADH dehydrogenase subunit 3 [Culicoides brevitarsis]WPN85963.1 NADH dehydrogenase subunit 3 [Culicoides brevitarsis]